MATPSEALAGIAPSVPTQVPAAARPAVPVRPVAARSASSSATWPPAAGLLPPPGDSPVPPPDRLADTGPVGLHTFNLGYIPASVTPPRTWRRAAWFAIFSSGAALIGLLFVTSMLVGPVTVTSDINSLPGLPTGLPFFTPPDSSGATPPTGRKQPANLPGQSGRRSRPNASGNQTDPASGAASPGDPAVAGGGSPQTSGVPVSGVPTTVVSAPPTVSTVNTAPPAVDPAKIGDRTMAFFSEVTSNVDAAANLTTGTVHNDAKAIIEQNYGGIAMIKVKSISLDPSNGLTVSVLQVTDKDGSVSTEQRTLQFTLTGDPKIENPAG